LGQLTVDEQRLTLMNATAAGTNKRRCAPALRSNCLFGGENSLLSHANFPVLMRREFVCKPMKMLIDWRKISAVEADF
jgi:hypothetical protein